MEKEKLSIRELTADDIDSINNYWHDSDASYLHAMGVDVQKLPGKDNFKNMLLNQLATPIEQKTAYCIIWQCDGEAIGHSNTNPTRYGEEAFMHLHVWKPENRRKGWGTELVRLSVAHFFEKLKLKRLYCQPHAHNPAPNILMQKAGFKLKKEYVTTPGSINYEQPVKLWLLTKED